MDRGAYGCVNAVYWAYLGTYGYDILVIGSSSAPHVYLGRYKVKRTSIHVDALHHSVVGRWLALQFD